MTRALAAAAAAVIAAGALAWGASDLAVGADARQARAEVVSQAVLMKRCDAIFEAGGELPDQCMTIEPSEGGE